jgi:hypothetical protein
MRHTNESVKKFTTPVMYFILYMQYDGEITECLKHQI